MQFASYGKPEDVLKLVDLPKPVPAKGEVIIRVLARSINPSDVFTIMGNYGVKPPLPSVPGNEAAGVIDDAGDSVVFKKGDRVTLLLGGLKSAGTWCEYIAADAKFVIKTPAVLSDAESAATWVNYLTAWLLVKEELGMGEKETLVMDAANSHLGRAMFQVAKHLNFKIVAIVRKKEQVQEMLDLGAKAAFASDEQDIKEELLKMTRQLGVKYAIDAVGGKTGSDIFGAMGRKGIFILYGLMSSDPFAIDGRAIFTEATLRGFWLVRWIKTASDEAKHALVTEVTKLFENGTFKPALDQSFDLADALKAIAYNRTPGKKGKVILTG